ncbi:cytochrome c biogenesis protein ResB [Phytohabitans rumicis]|uniref:Cytochrome c biogenesis protein n=1 Tax=Phytohabitans rumicis TaxID=1076125 RepID=A0A6V8L6E1_9ACTN|nr:cytochrome c biogenesis protein ResB [Phytohabitans rumicis]GFJ90209.1 cytochrome c biogenesis protein [Phytohabitans rumicis]
MVAVQERPPTNARPNPVLAFLRNSWRQLTSMRTALILLFLLAIAAIPGSVLPQRSVNIEKVNQYYVEHPSLAPWLNRLGMFEVFASVWFSAIYVLLFTSLVGCVLPRLRDHYRALRSVPPNVPARLDRLPQHAVLEGAAGIDDIAAALRKRRWRVAVRDDTVSAEKGYLKETGNLIFHFALLAVLAGVGFGSWYGWHGNRLLVVGSDTAFCNNLQQYDEYGLGARIKAADLPRFCLELTDFKAEFLPSGQPSSYQATARVDDGPPQRFSVNSPLRLGDANVYLLGHGYAPIIRYTDRYGQSQTTVAPFLTVDGMLTSEGVAAFPDANVDPRGGARDPNLQVAFEGLYLPTAPDAAPYTRSVYPAERSPALMLWAYRGNLGLDVGLPQSVYTLDQRQVNSGRLKPVGEAKLLRVGEKMTLDDGTTAEFLGTRQYATLSVRYDPGEFVALGGAATGLAGLMLSLTGRRRRVFFRVTTGSSRLVEAGGLPRTDYSGFAEEFQETVKAVTVVEKR